MKRGTVPALAMLLFMTSTALCQSQEPQAKYDPALPSPGQAKPKQSFVDFSLGRINSDDRDYGWCISQDRTVLLSETIDKGYFWSNVLSLSFMASLFLIIIFQYKRNNRDAWKLSEIVAQYKHALIRCQEQLQTANGRNADLMHFIARLEESIPQPVARRNIPASSVAENSKQSSLSQNNASSAVATLAEKAVKTAEIVFGNSKAKIPNAQIALFAEGDVVMKINSQEQQITALREQVNLLRGQLTESEQKLRTEKGRNRTLKGA